MKILVTGCAGFIGMHTCLRLLARGDEVVGIDNLNDYYDVRLKEDRLAQLSSFDNFSFLKLDMTDHDRVSALFARQNFQRVVHLAAQPGVRYSLKNPLAYIQSNLVGFTNILEGCRHHKIEHLVFASSSSVYGANTAIPFSVNQNVDHPVSLYAATKKAGELISHSYSHLYGLPATCLRFFTGCPLRCSLKRYLSGQTILECGSGAGRFTEVLLQTGAQVYSFDYSDAVDANFKNNGAYPNLALFQASIYDIPLPQASFDKVICLGVIQHTPDPELSFKCIANMVRPGGELVIDVYANTLAARLQWYYFLRPITRRMDKAKLYEIISKWTPRLIPLARFFRAIAGRAGARLVPIVEFSYLGLPPELNREWAILDTFDQYSPAHDHPQTEATVQRWFESAGFNLYSPCSWHGGQRALRF